MLLALITVISHCLEPSSQDYAVSYTFNTLGKWVTMFQKVLKNSSK